MNVNSLIVEQLEHDGTLKTFTMKTDGRIGDLVIAFADEYNEPREGPFHFLNSRYEKAYNNGFKQCCVRKLGKNRFLYEGNIIKFNTGWKGIPTKRNELSYYALYLPEYAAPIGIHVFNPYFPGKEFKRSITKDLDKNRYIIYLECRSSYGTFDFDIECKFYIDHETFTESLYNDDETSNNYGYPDVWKCFLPQDESDRINNIFLGGIVMGDNYNIKQGGAIGPNSSANNNTFNQENIENSINLKILADELTVLREALKRDAKDIEHDIAIGSIAVAEQAVKDRDTSKAFQILKSSGKWVSEVAKSVGTDLVVSIIKNQSGL